MKAIKRREFIKYGIGGLTLIVGGKWLSGCGGGGGGGVGGAVPPAGVAVQSLNFEITDAVKQMVTHNSINSATCYYWIYKDPRFPADCPGPHIFATAGDTIEITLTNRLDEPHAFAIPGVFESGPVNPGATATFSFTAPAGGSYLYYDNLNEPVNRVMGLHGAFVSMPAAPAGVGNKFTPYTSPTASIQALFNDFGTAAWWPGLSWEQGDVATDTPPFRQYIWLTHQSSSRLFAEVGNSAPGSAIRNPVNFRAAMLNDPFRADGLNRKAEYFTISGQSGHFSHASPYICPNNRVGEPVVVRILNAGLHSMSMHVHANHFFVTSINGVPQDNPIWIDVFGVHPLDRVDYVLPYMRPPDVPNTRGIGRADTPLVSLAGRPVWPPVEELAVFMPAAGTLAGNGVTSIAAAMSPLCYPMHDHLETSQTSQGGNYNLGAISGLNFTGDRNTPGGVTTFANTPTIHGPSQTGPPAIDF